MTTIEITTTEKDQKVELQLSPRSPQRGRLLVNGFATDARFQSDDSIEDVTFLITSSSPITSEATAKIIASRVLEVLNK